MVEEYNCEPLDTAGLDVGAARSDGNPRTIGSDGSGGYSWIGIQPRIYSRKR